MNVSPRPVVPIERATGDPEAPVALILVHGMGQQIPYGVLDDGYRLLKAEARRRGGDVFLEREAHHAHAGHTVSCAELCVRLPEGERRVHLFEGYWAPITEGRISTWETFRFLFGSALRCTWESLRRGFTRFIFDQPCPFPVRVTSLIGLTLTAAALAALAVFDTTFVAVVVSGILAGAEPRWLSPALRLGYIHDFTLLLAVLVATAFVSVGVPLALARARRQPWLRPVLARYAVLGDWAARGTVLVVTLLGLRLLLRTLLEAAPGLRRVLHPLFDLLERGLPPLSEITIGAFHVQGLPATSRSGILMIGLAVLAFSTLVRWFVRTYLGDVAIYVSSHTVNRFYAARAEIRQAAGTVGEFVYGRRDARGEWTYRNVVVMGHSLGSVIAYDLVNRLILEDANAPAAARRDAARRTRALITYGSPLDKTAFVFRAQQNAEIRVREAMAASVQPLISDPRARGLDWINVYSRFDWIGGSLEYYDLPEDRRGDAFAATGAGRVKPVVNLEDEDALTPILAHGEHDRGTLLPELVMDAALGRLAAHPRVRAARAAQPTYRVLPEAEDVDEAAA